MLWLILKLSFIYLSGTFIMNGLCQEKNSNSDQKCEIYQIFANGQCLNGTIIGGMCQLDAQCAGGSRCFNQHCSCPSGTIYSQEKQICMVKNCSKNEVLINGTCLLRVIPGQKCSDSAQCLDGSQCSSTARCCICLEGMNNIGGYCRKLSSVDPCDSISMIYVNGSCVRIAKLGDQCIHDFQCLGGSVCIDGYCNCQQTTKEVDGYCIASELCNENEVLLNNRCFKRVVFNESCFVSQQCPDNAICNYAAQCTCPAGTAMMYGRCQPTQNNYCSDLEVMVNGVCLKRRVPGKTCFASEQCLDGSSCLNGYCKCSNDTELRSRYCIPRNMTKRCDIYETYVNGKCLDLAIPGEDCIDSLQCIAGSNCYAGKCICSKGYIEIMKYCVKNLRPSTECSNQVLINDHCYDFVEIGQYCVDTAVCLNNSICYNNYCTCPKNTIIQNGRCQKEKRCTVNEVQIDKKCFPKINIGQHCQFTKQCTSISTCQNGICICPSGMVAQNNNCTSSGICLTGQIYIAESCWDIAHIGQQCKFTQQCQGYSACIDNRCQCPHDSIVQEGLCIKEKCNINEIMIDNICFQTAKIGEFCHNSQQCQGHAICQTNRCLCPSGTIKLDDTCIVNSKCRPYQVSVNGSCLDTVSIGMTCKDDSQCIESANCMPGKSSSNHNTRTCQCANGTIFNGTKCLPTPIQCPETTAYIVNKGCFVLVEIGEFCMDTAQCMGYSVCSGQICKCPHGYNNVHNVCRINDHLLVES